MPPFFSWRANRAALPFIASDL
ncbi:MAG: hypothetical protein RI907_83, partial [Pseudomonadota bacterium]